ncbi:MAG: hypothetical protein AB7G48_18065 [Nitrospiraceae bacterium]
MEEHGGRRGLVGRCIGGEKALALIMER